MKIGNMVYSKKFGKGKIIYIEEAELPYGVKFETFNIDLHDLSGRCKSGYGLWCTDNINHDKPDEIITPYKFTKKDLKTGDKLTTRGGAELIYNSGAISFIIFGSKHIFGLNTMQDLNEDLTMKDRKFSIDDIVKVERPTYTTVFEREDEILDEKEKEYLFAVIRPFKDRVKYIEKSIDLCDEYIYIRLDDDSMQLPNFEKDTMYKEMELGKEYTLEELGLD